MTKKDKLKLLKKIIRAISNSYTDFSTYPDGEDYNISQDVIYELDREFWKQYFWEKPSEFKLKISKCNFSKAYKLMD